MTVSFYIYKIVQRCNLNCKYCYVYNLGDESWRHRPAIASIETTRELCRRIEEHLRDNGASAAVLSLHGGEPLLMGKARFRRHVKVMRDSAVRLEIYVQTNAMLLDTEWLSIFDEFDIRFGVSLDGPRRVHDSNRVDHAGRGSYETIVNRLTDLSKDSRFGRLFGGVLAVIDPKQSGSEILKWFHSVGLRGVDFLLPDTTRRTPLSNETMANCRSFLIDAFDAWLLLSEDAPSIRFFEQAIVTKSGSSRKLDALGGTLTSMCVIESDGEVFSHDVLRIATGAFEGQRIYVKTSQIGELHRRLKTSDVEVPCEKCRQCVHFRSCGGGYLPHRWDGSTFDNPSAYCDALFGFYEHVEKQLRAVVPEGFWIRRQIGS